MAQVAKSTQDFELFGGLNPGTVRVSTENSKDKVILVRCAIFRPATAEFRFKDRENSDALTAHSGALGNSSNLWYPINLCVDCF